MVANLPDGVSHVCEYCATEEEPVTAKTHTEDELKAAVDAAVAAVVAAKDARISELEAEDLQDSIAKAVEAAVAEVTTAKAAEIADLMSQVATESAARKAADENHAAVLAWLETEAETAHLKEVAGERLSKIEAVGVFTDELIEKNKERWVAMTDEAFAAQLEEYEQIAALHPKSNPVPSTRSAMTASAGASRPKSAASEVINLRRKGVDIRHMTA